MDILGTKKRYYFTFLFFLFILMNAGCAHMGIKKELDKKDEEIKTIKIELQARQKANNDLFNRLSWRDQEIGKLTEDLRTASITIKTLQDEIERLKKTDLLDRLSMKDQEIGKLTDTVRTSNHLVETLKNEIEKLKKTDLQERLSLKEREIEKLSEELNSAGSTIEKLRELDIQMEGKRNRVDHNIKDTAPVKPLEIKQENGTAIEKEQG
jgi:chromosome segregation ATPase